MKQIILDGKSYANQIELNIKEKVEVLKKQGKTPTLATILVGNDEASKMYVKMKNNACKRVGINNKTISLPDTTTTEKIISVINELNIDKNIDGILLQHPVPNSIDENQCFNAINIDKDVDGVNMTSFGKFSMKGSSFVSCTPLGIIKLLKHYNIQLNGKKAIIVGRSAILGKPLSMLLLNENCTVTICHSHTKDLDNETKNADIVIGCSGKSNIIKKVKKGAVLIDCGFNKNHIGDIDKKCIKKASAYTPIPGGVGPMTIAMLLMQTISSAEKKLQDYSCN